MGNSGIVVTNECGNGAFDGRAELHIKLKLHTDAERPEALYAIIEVKQVKAKDGKEQLRSYTNATGAPLAVWSRGAETIVWNRKDPNFFIEIPEFR